MARRNRLADVAAGLMLALGPVAPALAQEAAPPARAEAAIPDELIMSFAEAVLEINEIAESYQPRLADTEDATARAAIEEEAQLAMIQAIEETEGITMDEYLAISQAARVDESVKLQVMQRLEEMASSN